MGFLENDRDVWMRLADETRPIVLYGMGDGAQKILDVCAARGISVAAVFASDEFVRGHSFAGFPVQRLDEVTAALGEDIVIVISFASQRPELLARFDALAARFDVVAPDVPVAGGGLFDLAYARAHADALRRTWELLADETSRRCFAEVVRFKLTGRISCLRACETDKDEAFIRLLRPSDQEHFVDLGAYNGDTIRELLSYTDGHFASITALEPDRRNFRKLSQYAAHALHGVVRLEQAGAWSHDTVLTFAARAGRNSALARQGVQTPMRAVDSVLRGAPCTLLKLDVEGSEREALFGAAQTIARDQPRMNIACYHRNEDLFALPALVHEMCPAHALYLRHHPYVPAWDVNLYAAPQK